MSKDFDIPKTEPAGSSLQSIQLSCGLLPTSRNNSSASIESWTRAAAAASRRGSEEEGHFHHNPVVQAYIQAKMALFDREMYLQVNGS